MGDLPKELPETSAKGMKGVALITGAGGGIGRETAYSLAEAGVIGIAFADLDEKGAQESAETSKTFATHPDYHAIVIGVNVTDPISVQSMVGTTLKEFGRIDYSIHCAGIGADTNASIIESSVDEYLKLSNVNAIGTMLCVQAVSKAMSIQEPLTVEGRNGTRNLGRGSIVNLGSALSYIAVPGSVAYTSSKHAVLAITKTAALDNVPHNIRVNAVCPSWVNTPMMARDFDKNPYLEDWVKRASPLGRMAEPEEVGDVITFLCSPAASYVNGTGLIIDSGVTLSLHLC